MVSLLKDKANENKQLQKKVKKLEEKYVELHKREKGLLKDRETFIGFMHLVFPQQILDEVLISEAGEGGAEATFGLYDIEHLQQFWTLYKQQTDAESTHIIAHMREEKQMLMQKIQSYERDIQLKDEAERRGKEAEDALGKLQTEISEYRRVTQMKDTEIAEYQERLEQIDVLQDRVRALERENSEMKAAKLMNLFPGGGTSQAKPAQNDKLIESLKVQLSEKTNDYLRLKEENERLKEQIEK